MKTTFDLNVEEIFIHGQTDHADYAAEDFIIFPEAKEKYGGYLCGFLEFRGAPRQECQKLLSTIIDTLRLEYYSQIINSPDPTKLHLETIFEHALQKTNHRVWELMEIGHFSVRLNNLHYVIAAVKPHDKSREIEIFLVQQGLTQAFLIHQTQKNLLKTIDIIGNAEKIKTPPTEKIKLFSTILSGKIFQHDTLYFCSEMFHSFFPPSRIQSLLATTPLTKILDSFKSTIHNLKTDSPLAFAGIFLNLKESHPLTDKPLSQKSIDTLMETKDKTEKYLSPSLAINFNFNPFKWLLKKSHSLKLSQARKTDSRVSFFKKSGNLFSGLLDIIRETPRTLHAFLSGKKSISLKSLRPKFSRASLGLLLAVFICTGGLIAGIFEIKKMQAESAAKAEYDRQVTEIKGKLNDAQVNLIYQNFEAGLSLVKNLENAITYLPQATPEQQSTYQDLHSKWQTMRNRLLNIEKIIPKVVLQLESERLSFVRAVASRLFISGDSGKLFYLDPTAGTISGELPTTGVPVSHLTAEDTTVIAIKADRTATTVNATENPPTSTTSTLPLSPENSADLELFNGNLYALNPTDTQIFKHTETDGIFAAGTAWIKDPAGARLTEAIDITIDGGIFILTRDGSVYRFFNGQKEEFSLSPVEPALLSPTKILADQNYDKLLILDSPNKRLLIFAKTGSFIKQWQFDSLDEPPSDLTLLGENLYLTAGHNLYRLPRP